MNASYVYGLEIVNTHMRRALGAVTTWDTFREKTKDHTPSTAHNVQFNEPEVLHIAPHVHEAAGVHHESLAHSKESLLHHKEGVNHAKQAMEHFHASLTHHGADAHHVPSPEVLTEAHQHLKHVPDSENGELDLLHANGNGSAEAKKHHMPNGHAVALPHRG